MINRRFLKYYALALIVLLIASALLFLFIKDQFRDNQLIRLKLESNIVYDQLLKQIDSAMSEIKSDLNFLSDKESLLQTLRANRQTGTRQTIEQLWISFSKQRARYDQIRLLDLNGQEIIRVNYNSGQPSAVAGQALQSKKGRYYFSESIILDKDDIYISPLDLNIEQGDIELPLKPMIRFATPVTDKRGNNIGVVVINYLAESMLEVFRRSSTGFTGKAALINNDGFPLSSPESALNWNFMFPDSPQTGEQARHPEIWSSIKREQRGQVITDNGLFTYGSYSPEGNYKSNNCDNCLIILLSVSNELLNKKLNLELKQALPPLILALIFIGVTIGILLWHMEKRRSQEEEINSLNEEIAHERDLFVNGPGVIVKTRNEIGWPVDFISSNIEGFLNYNQDQFLSGSLNFSSIINPEDLKQYIQEIEQIDSQGKEILKRSPYRLIDSRGENKWVQDITQPIRNKQGKISHYHSHIIDISALKQTEHKLKQSHDYIQRVVDTIPDPTLVIDISNYQLMLANNAARNLYNGGRNIGRGMTCHLLSHKREQPCTGMNDPCPIQEVILSGKTASVRHKHFTEKGKMLFVDVLATPIFNEAGTKVVQVIESHRDVTEAVELEKQLQHMATTDRLTKVYNRMKFDEELKSQIEWAQSTKNPLGLIMFDLDHFKSINDTYGHDVGDEVLKRVVGHVMSSIRKSDTLARWGGEEFMIITPLTDIFELKTIAESLRVKLEKLDHDTAGQVTASFGGSVLKPHDTFSSLIKRVDSALYESKQNGRNRCTLIE
jgi:diguanylate cyclase (GGDEF)-like protein/PAS domain S-box-containing protein